VLFFVRFDITQPDDVSNEQLFETWKREAAAAVEALDASVLHSLYKVAGERTVLGVIEVGAPEELDRALGGLPIVREMGSGVNVEAKAVYDYRTYADDMNAGVHS
jgi:muconolactone delta-isomerase